MMNSEFDIRNASILIVDDQPANVLLLEQLLAADGYTQVTSTMDPRTVWGLHAENRYDLILLDLKMPHMDGFEVMEGLRKSESGRYLPVIVLTAEPGHKMRALQAGATDFISKPFDLAEVKMRIRHMLEVRVMYKKTDNYTKLLEIALQQGTADLAAAAAARASGRAGSAP